MTGITPEGFEIDRDFAAPPSAVFAAWTTAEHFARWFGGKDVQVPADRLDYEPAAGRAWSATMVLPDGNTIDWTGEFHAPDAGGAGLHGRAAQGHHRRLADVLRRSPADRRNRLTPGGPCQRVRGRLGGQVWLDPPVLDAWYAPLLPNVHMRIGISRTAHIPSQIWALLWLGGTLLAVVGGGKWLVLRS